jgi:hypothetical protein
MGKLSYPGNTRMSGWIRNVVSRNQVIIPPSTLPVIPTDPTEIYCQACCDDSEDNLDEAKAIVINCMDFRLRDNVTCHLNNIGYKNDYDEGIVAGTSAGYMGLYNGYTDWETFIDETILTSHNLHKTYIIMLIEHENCGVYKNLYGSLPTNEMYPHHVENSAEATQILWNKFGPDGTISQIPNLIVISYIITINGCTLKELHRMPPRV